MRVALAAGVLLLLHAYSFGGYVADDAAISLSYAKNLVEGHGLVLTPGSERVEGYSNPLWVAILSLAVFAGADPLRPVLLFKVLGGAFALATIALTGVLARRAYGPQPPIVSWFAPVLVALSTPFAFWAVAGLENALYAFLITASVLLYVREVTTHPRSVWSAVALAAVALTRPEGVALFVAFAVHRAGVVTVDRMHVRTALAWAATFTGIYGLFVAWRFSYFAAWLPNTYYAKLSGRDLSRLPDYLTTAQDPGWRYLGGFVMDAGPLIVLLAIVGLLAPRHRRVQVLIAGVVAAMALYVIYTGGDWWPAYRFLSALIPLIAVCAQAGLSAIVTRTRRHAAVAAVALALAAALHANARASGAIWQRTDDDLVGLAGRLAQGQRIRALADAAGIRNPTYLEPDIGGPSLTPGLRIVDLGGLADVHIARFHYYPAFFRTYIFEEQRPHFIRTHSVWTRASRITEYPEFERDYVAIVSWRDEYGQHGEYMRRDLVAGGNAGEPAAANDPANDADVLMQRGEEQFAQGRYREAMDSFRGVLRVDPSRARARHRLEDAREQTHEIAYLYDTDRFDVLYAAVQSFTSGSDPGARELAEDLELVRTATPRVVLHENGQPTLALLHARQVHRDGDIDHRVRLYFKVLRPPTRHYQLWLHAYPSPAAQGDRPLTWGLDPRQRSAAWDAGSVRVHTFIMKPPPGRYELRTGFWQPHGDGQLCVNKYDECYVSLGSFDF